MINVKVVGLKTVTSNIDRYSKEIDIGVQGAMEKVTELIVEKARSLAPVETGDLRASVQTAVRKMASDIVTGSVEATIKYAQYIEFGTSTQKAQPFLTPALEEGLAILGKEMQEAHRRAARRLSKS